MQVIPITRQIDKEVLKSFKELFISYESKIGSVQLDALGGIRITNVFKDNELISNILQHESTLISSLTISFPRFQIIYYRGGHQKDSPFIDEIHIGEQGFSNNQKECPLSDSEKLSIAAMLSKQFCAITPSRAIKGSLNEDQHELLAIHQETLSRLENLSEDLIKKSHEFRQQIESEYVKRKEELENSSLKELNEKLLEVQKQKEQLSSKIKDIDDRNNTHVRRQLRQNILEEIQNRSNEFKLTKGTNHLRTPVHFVCILVSIIFGTAAWFYGKEVLLYMNYDKFNLSVFIVMTIKQFAFTVVSGGTAIFYIKWLNRWFELHSNAEFNIKQFQLDIERSSWIVETILEWNKEKDSTFPIELMQQLTKNLFDYEKTKSEPIKHPADYLASALLGTASSVNINAGNAQLGFNGKNLKKAISK